MNKIYYLLLILIGFSACESLDVPNTNQPDRETIIDNPRDFKNFVENIYLTYWQALKGDESANMHLATLSGADQITSSWYNFGCYEFSMEPRIAFYNTVSYEYEALSNQLYRNMFVVTYMSNNLLREMNKGTSFSSDSSTNMGYRGMAYLMQGLALGQLGLTYDSAQVVSEFSDFKYYDNPRLLKFSHYKTVIDSAIVALDKAIEISKKYNFNLGSNIVRDVPLTNDLISRLAHSYAGRFLALSARTKAENSQVDWKKVYTYTKQDVIITEDFGPYGDGGINWSDQMMKSLVNVDNNGNFFDKIDCRLIHLMDPAYPAHYPSSGRPPRVHTDRRIGEAKSDDLRLNKYFEYSQNVRFLADRGIYHFSHYRYKRFDEMAAKQTGRLIELRAYEIGLLNAEASVMLNVNSNAINYLNFANNPRKSVGGLPDISATADKNTVLKAIFYEREVELLGQTYLTGFCDMRRRDLLQKGTPLHFPIPAEELQTLKRETYFYGGVDNADGTNTSNGGW